ncbi:MAG: leucine-rich repeat domain-containing protein [Clostridiales bacterium]|nr:leucine-rich repeat domain-containing protein [Clostridiales bacterium]
MKKRIIAWMLIMIMAWNPFVSAVQVSAAVNGTEKDDAAEKDAAKNDMAESTSSLGEDSGSTESEAGIKVGTEKTKETVPSLEADEDEQSLESLMNQIIPFDELLQVSRGAGLEDTVGNMEDSIDTVDDDDAASLDTDTVDVMETDDGVTDAGNDVSDSDIEVDIIEETEETATVNASTVVSGTCGDNLTWTLDSDGLLTISGTGAMPEITYTSDIPWYDYRESVITLIIEEGVTGISQYAFLNCTNLVEVTIPASVTSIDEGAFYGCTGLVTMTVASDNQLYCSEDNVLFDKEQTTLIFCTPQKSGSYTIPSTVESISDRAFEFCVYLEELTIQDNLSSIGKRVFTYCADLTYITVSSSNQYFSSVDGVLFDKDQTSLILYPKNLSGSYTIPSSVTTIANWAFYGCAYLTDITIGENVTDIGEVSFTFCTGLTSVTIPDSVSVIGGASFYGCTNLSEFMIGSGVTEIDVLAFVGCTGLEEIFIMDNVTSIGTYALGYDATSVGLSDDETSFTVSGVTKLDGNIPVIYGYTGTEAETYASDNELTFITVITNYVVTLATTSYIYDGTAKEPEVTVTYGSTTLTRNSDYTVSYSDNVSAGTATAKVEGTGSYAGSVTKSFTISQRNISDCTITLSQNTYTYDGTAKKPAVTVMAGTATLTEGTDYTVSYGNNVNAGTATVTVTGAGSCSGAVTATFTIVEESSVKDISSCTITLSINTYTYDGAAKQPTVTVKDGSTTLTGGGTDYSLDYADNINAGTATVTVKGCGNYTGTKTATFTINKTSQSIVATISSNSVKTGKAVKISAYANGTLSYSSSNTKVAKVSSAGVVTGVTSGTATITVKAAATTNYNAATKTFTVKVSMDGAKVTSVTNTAKGVVIKWNKVSGASGYYIYSKMESSTLKKVAKCTGNSTVSYTDKTAKNGIKYTYYVYPYIGSTKGSCSKTGKIVRLSTVSIISAKNSGTSAVTVKWKKNSAVAGYEIYFSTSKSFTKNTWRKTVDNSIKKKAITNKLFKKGKTFYVKIRTYKTVSGTKSYSAWSSVKKVKITK